jgi:hypothetical protein
MPRCSFTRDSHDAEAVIKITFRAGRCQCPGEVVKHYCEVHAPWWFGKFHRADASLLCEHCKEPYAVSDEVKTIENLTR